MGHGLQNPGDLQFPFDLFGWTRRTDGQFNGFNAKWSRESYPAGGHEGIDWACPVGTPIRAMAAGRVVETHQGETQGGEDYGNFVRIQTGEDKTTRTEGFEHLYGHLSEVYVRLGQIVTADQLIGLSGNTGRSTGPHLHVLFKPFGVNTTNPHGLIRPREWSPPTWQDQRMILGCIDFSSYLPSNGAAGFELWKVPALGHPMATLQTALRLKTKPDLNSLEVNQTDLAAGTSHALIGRDNIKYALIDPPTGTTAPTPDWWQIVAVGVGMGWVPARQVKASGDLSAVTVTWPSPGDIIMSVSRDSDIRDMDFRSSAKRADDNILGQITDQDWRRVLAASYNHDDGYVWYQIGVFRNVIVPPLPALPHRAYTTGWVREDEVAVKAVARPLLRGLTDSVALYGDPRADARTLDPLRHYEPYPINGQYRNSPTWWRIPYSDGHGWVRSAEVQTEGDVSGVPVTPAAGRAPISTTIRYLRLRSWVTGLYLRTGPSQAFAAYRLLTDRRVWYEVVGQTGTTTVWYRIQYDATFRGWVHSAYVELTERTISIPTVTPPSPPAEKGPAGEAATGTGATSGSASGDFRNLVTNPDGRWAVWKAGTTVTANFSSPRSPVQYYARENRQPQFVLPVGFRPTATVTHTVTGTRVNENRTPVANAQPATFDLTIGTNGEMRYANNAKVNGLGFVSYSVTHLTWQTNEALVTPKATGTLSATGTYLNQQVNWGSQWTLARSRSGTRVTGRFSCTRSPVDYYANGKNRAAQLRLPSEYRPAANTRFQVTGAIRVNENGADSTDKRKVNFWLTVQRNGEMWYDADTHLQTLGVGFLRYTVDVAWTAPALVPTVPQELEAEEVEATEVELDWRASAYNGGARITEYRVEEYRNGSWRTEEDDITSSRYTVEDLDPYTTYTWRVRARNSAGWSEPSPAITVTTPRQAPGAPSSLSASATHEAVTLTWGSATGTVTGYHIERRVGNGSWCTLVSDTGETARGWEDRDINPATRYYYRVRAYHHGEAGNWSSSTAVTTPAAPTIPGQPTGLTVSPGTDHRLQLTWTAPGHTGGGVTGYRLQRSPDEMPRAWAVVREDTGSAALTWGDDDVAADTVYHYRVSARNRAGVSRLSAVAQGRSRPQLSLAATAAYPLTAHAEPRAEASVTAIFHVYEASRALDLVGQVPGTDSWWQVRLFGQSAQGPFWLPAMAGTAAGDTTALPQPPAAPQSFTATLVNRQVNLRWQAPATGDTVTGYRLWRQVDNGAWTQRGVDLRATIRTHTDTSVQHDHVYRYWLQALGNRGPGVPSDPIALAVMTTPVAPAAITNVQVTATARTLRLTWTRATTGGLPTGYRVQWRVAGTTTDFQTAAVIGTAHELTELTPGTTYDLQVTAFNQVGDASPTTQRATTGPLVPGVPTALQAAPGADSQMTLTWTAPPTGTPAIGYRIERSADVTPRVWTEVVSDTGNTHVTWRDRGLAAATVYHYRVTGRNAAGLGTPSAVTQGKTRPQLALKATAPYPLKAYQWPATTAPVTHTWTAHDTTVSLDMVGQVSGPNGWWRVLRFGEAASGPYWLPTDATTVTGSTTSLPQAPDTPGTLKATATHDTVALTWTAPTTGGTVTGYRLWRQTGTGTLAILGNDLAADALTHTDTGLTAETTYQYRVQALAAAGAGPRTAAVSVTTAAAVTPRVHNYGPGSHTMTIPTGYQTLYIQLCGGGGGGGGANLEDKYSGEIGGQGGCTFASFPLKSGDTWTLAIGSGGAGGDTDEDDPDDGRNGTASFLRRNGSVVATGAYGHGGEAAVGWYQSATTGATSGHSRQFPEAWPGDASAPRGGRRGTWLPVRDGRRGASGLARVLLV